jgi:putative membrane protein
VIEASGRARATAITAATIGLFVATGVIAYFNAGRVLAAIEPIGIGGFLVVIVAQVLLFIPLGLAWWLPAGGTVRQAPLFVWGRLMREAASDVLPFSQLGGMVIAARAVVLGGVTTPVAFGSCVVDVTFEMAAQLIYTLFGIATLIAKLGFAARGDKLVLAMVISLVMAMAIVGGFIATQRRGLGGLEKLARKMIPSAAHHATAITKVIEGSYRRPGPMWGSIGLHLASWFGGAAGTWLILDFIDHPLPFMSVAAIEALLFAVKNSAFFVPSGLGVQEGAYAVLGPLFGLPADVALALSLLKRARDICVGVPILLSWQFIEGRRRLRHRNA